MHRVTSDHTLSFFFQGSWKKKLRDRFKWLRRKPTSEDTESIEGEPSTPKRRKVNNTKRRLDKSGADYAADEDDYDEIVCSMKKEFTKPQKDRDNVKIQQDMNLTFKQRRSWLKQARSVQEVFEKFPNLHTRKVVSLLINCILIDDIIYLFKWLF